MSQKLPAWKIAKKSISLIFRDFGIALRAMWLAVLVAVLLEYFHKDLTALLVKAAAGLVAENADIITVIPNIFITTLVTSFASVFWHRHILLQEKAVPLVPLRFDMCNMRYLIANFLLFFAPLLIVIICFLMVAFVLPAKIILLLGLVIATPIMFYFLYRLSIILLPAIATDDQESSSVGKAWQLTRGHTGAIIGLMFIWCLVVAAFLAPDALMRHLLEGQPAGLRYYNLVSMAVMTFFLTLFAVGLTSISYALLTHKQNPQEDAPSEGP